MAVATLAWRASFLGALIQLSGWQKVEIFCVLAGLALLVAGHIGWFREQGEPNNAVSFNLMFGALLAGVPLMIASAINRFG